MEDIYIPLKQFVFRGVTNCPDKWSGFGNELSSKRYCFESNYWLLFTRIKCVTVDTPFGEKIFSGELEHCNSGSVYPFYLGNDLIVLVNSSERQYLENHDTLPFPKYCLDKVREIHSNLSQDENYYKSIKADNQHYSNYNRRRQREIFK